MQPLQHESWDPASSHTEGAVNVAEKLVNSSQSVIDRDTLQPLVLVGPRQDTHAAVFPT